MSDRELEEHKYVDLSRTDPPAEQEPLGPDGDDEWGDVAAEQEPLIERARGEAEVLRAGPNKVGAKVMDELADALAASEARVEAANREYNRLMREAQGKLDQALARVREYEARIGNADDRAERAGRRAAEALAALRELVEAIEAIPDAGEWGTVGGRASNAVLSARALLGKESE